MIQNWQSFLLILVPLLGISSFWEGSNERIKVPSSTTFVYEKVDAELCLNGIDDDGDGNTDCEDSDCGVTTLPFANNQAASFVVGQPDFTSRSASRTAATFSAPYDVALDPTTGKVFICDLGNNRVLRYTSIKHFIFNQEAEGVLGQSNFTNGNAGVSATRMNSPTGIHVDNTGTLWVSEFCNSRVLRFDNASNKSNGAIAPIHDTET